jgi:crossover junction endodeoxyribonuclease RuvC
MAAMHRQHGRNCEQLAEKMLQNRDREGRIATEICRDPTLSCCTAATAGRFGLAGLSTAFPQRSGMRAWRMFALRARISETTKSGRTGMRIMGLDPGLRRTGWGVVAVDGSRLRHVSSGVCVPAPRAPLAARLAELFALLSAVVEAADPAAVAVEQTFVSRDGAATLKLGHARGIALLVPARAGLPVAEYAPNAVKKAVVGTGHADKAQIAHMVAMLLPGARPAGPDAADALAVAICHAHHLQTARRVPA